MLACFLGLGPFSSVLAAQLVTFTRGHSIVVQSAEKRANWYYFTLDGGGEIGVPASRVARIEDYEAPPPSAGALQASAPQPYSPNISQSTNPSQGPGGVGTDLNGSAANVPLQVPSADAAANVVSHGDEDWRYKVRMSGGPKLQTSGGGIRKPAGMGRPMGAGGLMPGGNPNQNPYARRPPIPPNPPQGNPQQ